MERAELAVCLGGDGKRDTGAAPVVVAKREPREFQAIFAQAVAGDGPVFLADPGWGAVERETLAAMLILADQGPADGRGWLMIPTGGTSGRMKFARHDAETLAAAVEGLRVGLGIQRMDAMSLLPLHHIGGLMAWVRAALTGGDFTAGDWPGIAGGRRPVARGWLSLVPTQLARLLADPAAVAWLRDFQGIFVGGGPLWPQLHEAAARAGLPLAPAYGATETAAMVTVLRPGDFRSGGRGCGAALPHAMVTVQAEGAIEVQASSLFRGYWPERRDEGCPWLSGDGGHWDERGSLHVSGRRDDVIITGGKKVAPAEVEAVAREFAGGRDLAVVGLPDADWGEVVTLAYDATAGPWDTETMEVVWRERLARYKHPKSIYGVSPWPRTAAGKLDRPALLRRLLAGD